jgi:hypothetical protein
MLDLPPPVDIVLVADYDCITRTCLVDIVLQSDAPIWTHATDIALSWSAKHMTLVGCDLDRATVGNTIAGVPGLSGMPLQPWDFYGANTPLNDGNGYFMWLGPLTGAANPTMIDNDIIATLVFEVHTQRPTEVRVLESLTADFTVDTAVYAGTVPGLSLVGQLGVCKIAPCPAAASIN